MFKDLEEEDVYRDVLRTQILHNSFRAIVELRRNDDNLMTLIEHIFSKLVPEARPKVAFQVPTFAEGMINVGYTLRSLLFDPTRVIDGLCNNFAGSPVSFQFDHDQRPIRRNRKQIHSPSHSCIHLSTDKHPLIRYYSHIIGNHLL